MRFLLTLLLTVVFVPSFVGFFVVDGASSYMTSADAVLDTAREAKLRETLVEITEEHVYRELAKDAQMSSLDRAALAGIIDEVISKQWFEGTIRSAHGAMSTAFDAANDSAVFDFRPTKQQLARSLAELEGRADEECERLLGKACAPAVIATYRKQVYAALAQIPDEIDLMEAMTGKDVSARDRKDVEELRSLAGDLATVRLVALIGLLGCLVVIALLQLPRLSRVMLAVGLALAISSGAYFAVAAITSGNVRDRVSEALAKARERHQDIDKTDALAADAATRVTLAMVDGAVHRRRGAVGLLGLIGAGMAIAGIVTRK